MKTATKELNAIRIEPADPLAILEAMERGALARRSLRRVGSGSAIVAFAFLSVGVIGRPTPVQAYTEALRQSDKRPIVVIERYLVGSDGKTFLLWKDFDAYPNYRTDTFSDPNDSQRSSRLMHLSFKGKTIAMFRVSNGSVFGGELQTSGGLNELMKGGKDAGPTDLFAQYLESVKDSKVSGPHPGEFKGRNMDVYRVTWKEESYSVYADKGTRLIRFVDFPFKHQQGSDGKKRLQFHFSYPDSLPESTFDIATNRAMLKAEARKLKNPD